MGHVIDGRYRVDKLLGVGGMGRVYRARQLGPDRDVALKLVRNELIATPASLARFRAEATTLGRLRHPNIVTLYDFGHVADEGGATFYLTMELVDGPTLGEIVSTDGAMATHRVAAVSAQIAEGLAHAHARGVVHRDLKPANVAVVQAEDGGDVVKLLDFGVAKILDPALGDGVRTGTSGIVGTPAYMAPEQARGAVAPSADMFALGLLALEAMTGRPPSADAVARCRDASDDEPLASIVSALLSTEPALRPTAARAAELFAAIAAGRDARAAGRGGTLGGAAVSAVRPLGRDRALMATTTAIAILVGALGGALAMHLGARAARRGVPEAPAAASATIAARSGASPAEGAEGPRSAAPRSSVETADPAAPRASVEVPRVSAPRRSPPARSAANASAAPAPPNAPFAPALTGPPVREPPPATVFSTSAAGVGSR